MKLSKRLQTIADFVKKNSVVADIGTDHAHIPIYLIENNIIDKAYACDKMSNKEVDTIIIAGMGGELIIDILERGKSFFDKKNTFILSPHTKTDEVRDYLLRKGFEILKEDMCIDEGKFYTVMEGRYTENKLMYSEAELLYGKYLIENKHPVLLEFLKKEEEKYISILSNIGLNEDRKKELRHRLDIIKEIMNEMQ